MRSAIANAEGQFSQQIKIDYIFDSSEQAQSMVSELQGNILTAMSLVLVLVVATLGVRSGIAGRLWYSLLSAGFDDCRQYARFQL